MVLMLLPLFLVLEDEGAPWRVCSQKELLANFPAEVVAAATEERDDLEKFHVKGRCDKRLRGGIEREYLG